MSEDKNGHAQAQSVTAFEDYAHNIASSLVDSFCVTWNFDGRDPLEVTKGDAYFKVRDEIELALKHAYQKGCAARPAEQPTPPQPTKMTPVVREMSDIFNMVEGKRCCPKHIGCELHAGAEQPSAPPQPAGQKCFHTMPITSHCESCWLAGNGTNMRLPTINLGRERAAEPSVEAPSVADKNDALEQAADFLNDLRLVKIQDGRGWRSLKDGKEYVMSDVLTAYAAAVTQERDALRRGIEDVIRMLYPCEFCNGLGYTTSPEHSRDCDGSCRECPIEVQTRCICDGTTYGHGDIDSALKNLLAAAEESQPK